MSPRTSMLAAMVLAAVGNPIRADAPFFMGLGQLPDGYLTSSATLSRNGAAVVVSGTSPDGASRRLFHWTADTGFVRLPEPPISTGGALLSDNGNVVATTQGARAWSPEAGWIYQSFGAITTGGNWAMNGLSGDGTVGIRGNDQRCIATGCTDLGRLPGSPYDEGEAHALSADGSVIVGWGWNSDRSYDAYRWTAQTGKVTVGNGFNRNTSATSVSADGSVVVGMVDTPDGRVPFRWTATTGAQIISPQLVIVSAFPSIESSSPFVSNDGAVVVASNNRWSADAGWVPMAFRASSVGPAQVSSDGSVIVGRVGTSSATFNAAIWDATHGVRPLRDVLIEDYGLGQSVASWGLLRSVNISADGHVVGGYGYNPNGILEPWIAYLGSTTDPPIPGDANRDNIVDAADLAIVVSHLGLTTNATFADGDFNGDRLVSLADVVLLQNHFGLSHLAESPVANAAVPEPTTLGLALVAIGLVATGVHTQKRRSLVSPNDDRPAAPSNGTYRFDSSQFHDGTP